VRTFTAWCFRAGYITTDPGADLLAPHSPLKRFQKTYGKQQAKHPGRWLTRDEAFGDLIGVTQDGTDGGLRDELVIRFGLLGLRQVEIAQLRWAHLDRLPEIHWTGKGYKPRRATAGATLCDLIGRYRARYEAETGEPIDLDWPVICQARSGPKARVNGRQLLWRTPLGTKGAVFSIVNRAGRAAGLGHVAPHDLRRSAAGILHNTLSDDGGHRFDLLDIQKVLGHSDPATTMRSYLDPMDTGVYESASSVLD
jgi:integrase